MLHGHRKSGFLRRFRPAWRDRPPGRSNVGFPDVQREGYRTGWKAVARKQGSDLARQSENVNYGARRL